MHDEPDPEWDQERGLVTTRIGPNGKPVPKSMSVYDTDGTNLADVMAIEDVEFSRTVSNDMLEILSVRWCSALLPCRHSC